MTVAILLFSLRLGVSDVSLDLVCQLGCLDVLDERVQVDLVDALGFQEKIRDDDPLIVLGFTLT